MPDLKSYRTVDGIHGLITELKSIWLTLYKFRCPYKCSFCMINIINRVNNSDHITSENSNMFRWWSPEFIIKQFDLRETMLKTLKLQMNYLY